MISVFQKSLFSDIYDRKSITMKLFENNRFSNSKSNSHDFSKCFPQKSYLSSHKSLTQNFSIKSEMDFKNKNTNFSIGNN